MFSLGVHKGRLESENQPGTIIIGAEKGRWVRTTRQMDFTRNLPVPRASTDIHSGQWGNLGQRDQGLPFVGSEALRRCGAPHIVVI